MRNLAFIFCVALAACASLMPLGSSVQGADAGWRPNQTMYCSDGEFDWDSGQSLYDFVIQSRAQDDFIVSYLGIPHPSFETRDFFHIWMKMRGKFSSAYARQGNERIYTLQFNLDNEQPRTGTLTIAPDDTYKFSMNPPLARDTTTSGLCWASLPLTAEDRLPSCTPSPLEDTSKCAR
ncbi:MAG: hypothetical protein CBC43_006675 [Rhizobiales bacterium TMED83]|nr:hypothetical protein [Rhodobiaceae bacterium]RPF92690.1 MAG: hypothetical protein CBC43_006675 [Rhizobiales bacterium TMED83]|tara:strand:- start:256 stop:789 length:534 start_codon:yes stop_codon:yes gene_type:complete